MRKRFTFAYPYMKHIYSLSTRVLVLFLFFLSSCHSGRKATTASPTETNARDIRSKVVLTKKIPARTINTGKVSAGELVDFAETLVGVPYKYGSARKDEGFDCSGFIYYVFSHFAISVPRTSSDFTNAGKAVPLADSRRGDLILFTGSNPKSGVVGHMGIITENKKGRVRFIHSASGRGAGVMVSGMSQYFVDRYVKVVRVFKEG